MIRNYLKIAFRALIRDKAFSFLNIVGLAIGLSSVIMILAYVQYEFSYDKSYSNHPEVYRILQESDAGGVNKNEIRVPVGLAKALQKEIPSINSFSLVNINNLQFSYKNEIVNLNIISGSKDFFKLFNFEFINGNASNALIEPGSIVITENTARRFFNKKNPLGSYIIDNEGIQRHITGIIKDIPANTHITGDAIASLTGTAYNENLNWYAYTGMPQYVLLNKSADPGKVEALFKSIYKKYKFPANITLHLQPVTAIHLHSHTADEMSPNSDIKYIYIFLSVALLILVIACINYINLTIARSLRRAGEVGVRKVLGAMKSQLVIQFLTESFLFFAVTAIIAVLLSYILWPSFSEKITNYHQPVPLFNINSVWIISGIIMLGGILSGAYPAFFLSSMQPVKVLKGISKFGVNLNIRKILVIFQFVISGVLIIATIVVYKQLTFVNNASLGFNKNNLITIPFYIQNSHVSAFKNEVMTNNNIKGITVASWQIGMNYGGSSSMPNKNDSTKRMQFQFIDADVDFIKTMGIDIVSGRDFSLNYSNDQISLDSLFKKHLSGSAFTAALSSKSIVINQATVKLLALKEPAGTILKENAVQGTIIGVAQNFNGLTLHQEIPAVIVRCSPGVEFGQMYIRISPQKIQQTINFIEKKWKGFYPKYSFNYAFADDKLQELYTADKRLGAIFSSFSLLAVLIACLGLFGLISLTIQNRIKEIGIRKVLGASVMNITSLVSKDFLKLVILSFLISFPAGWYIMNKWLDDFAYHINIQWQFFFITAILILIIALVTLSYQSVKAALSNPVKSLRSE